MFFEAIPRQDRASMLTFYNFGNAAAQVARRPDRRDDLAARPRIARRVYGRVRHLVADAAVHGAAAGAALRNE